MKLDQGSSWLALGLMLLVITSSLGCKHLPAYVSFPFSSSHYHEVVEEAPPKSAFSISVDPSFRSNFPNRVVLVASSKSAGNYQSNQKLIRELASQFRAAGLFEVVRPDDVRLFGHNDNILQGGFEEREIAHIAREYNADCVAIVRVNELRSYAPIRTDVTIAFVDAAETIVGCGIDGDWDLALPERLEAFEAYVSSTRGYRNNDLHQQSPNALFRYVAYDMANALIGVVH